MTLVQSCFSIHANQKCFYALRQILENIGYWLAVWLVLDCRVFCFYQISFKYSKACDRVCIHLNNVPMKSARICMIIF